MNSSLKRGEFKSLRQNFPEPIKSVNSMLGNKTKFTNHNKLPEINDSNRGKLLPKIKSH
jgi:hypothetical protein